MQHRSKVCVVIRLQTVVGVGIVVVPQQPMTLTAVTVSCGAPVKTVAIGGLQLRKLDTILVRNRADGAGMSRRLERRLLGLPGHFSCCMPSFTDMLYTC